MKPKPRKLTARDICRGPWGDNKKGQRCAVGWIDLISRGRRKLWIAIGSEVCRLAKTKNTIRWNDNPRTPKREIARVINLAAKNLGLEIPQ